MEEIQAIQNDLELRNLFINLVSIKLHYVLILEKIKPLVTKYFKSKEDFFDDKYEFYFRDICLEVNPEWNSIYQESEKLLGMSSSPEYKNIKTKRWNVLRNILRLKKKIANEIWKAEEKKVEKKNNEEEEKGKEDDHVKELEEEMEKQDDDDDSEDGDEEDDDKEEDDKEEEKEKKEFNDESEKEENQITITSELNLLNIANYDTPNTKSEEKEVMNGEGYIIPICDWNEYKSHLIITESEIDYFFDNKNVMN